MKANDTKVRPPMSEIYLHFYRYRRFPTRLPLLDSSKLELDLPPFPFQSSFDLQLFRALQG